MAPIRPAMTTIRPLDPSPGLMVSDTVPATF